MHPSMIWVNWRLGETQRLHRPPPALVPKQVLHWLTPGPEQVLQVI